MIREIITKITSMISAGPRTKDGRYLTRGIYQITPARKQEWGFNTAPPNDHNAIILCVGGDPREAVRIMSYTDTAPPQIAEGEVAIYNNHGTVIKLLANGDVEISGGNLIVNGDIQATGDIQAEGDVKGGEHEISLTEHIHPAGDPTTGAPQ